MRVLYVSLDYTTHDWRFLSAISESQHQIFFLRLRDDGNRYENRSLPANVQAVSWEGFQDASRTPSALKERLPSFQKVLDQVKPDLIHAGPVQLGGYLTALAGFKPHLLMSWGSDIMFDMERDAEMREATRLAIETSSMFLVDCDAVREKVQSFVPYATDRFVQFPWGTDLDRFMPRQGASPLREKLGWQDQTVVLSARTWEKIYGIDIAVRAFAEAYRKDSRLRLLLLGNGSLSGEIHRIIADEGIQDVVHLAGRVAQSDLPEIFCAADVYLSASHSDGSSVSLLDAMACELPSIATDIPGNREWVAHQKSGWLARDSDVSHFAEGLRWASSLSGTQLAEVKASNRKIVEERADWKKNAQRMLAAYEKLGAKLGASK